MTEKDAVRRAYDRLAETYAERRSLSPAAPDALAGFLDPLPEDARLLDAGCGQGAPILARCAESTRAFGLDFSREQLRLASENAPAAELVRGDMTALPFRDGTFDAAVAFYSLIHVPADEHRVVLEEFARVLRPGGRLLLTEGAGPWTGSNPDWLDSGVEMHWDVAGAEVTRKQLRAAGFAVVDEWTLVDELAEEDAPRDPLFLTRLES